jgi:hypothetical protein
MAMESYQFERIFQMGTPLLCQKEEAERRVCPDLVPE